MLFFGANPCKNIIIIGLWFIIWNQTLTPTTKPHDLEISSISMNLIYWLRYTTTLSNYIAARSLRLNDQHNNAKSF